MTFSARQRMLRMLRSMSQADLEKLSGVPVSVISCIETGKIEPAR